MFFSKQLPSDEPNGVSCQVHRLAQALSDRGHGVTCASFSPPPAEARYQHLQLPRPRTSKVTAKFLPAFTFRAVRTGIYDILHYHGDDYLCPGRSNRVRTFYGSAWNEALHARSAGRAAYQALFYLFEWISCLRRGAKVGISRAVRGPLPLVKNVIPCGVDTELYRPEGAKTTVPSILFLGDMNSRKRGRLLLRTFEGAVLEKFPTCRMVVVGPQPCEGPNVRYAGRLGEQALIEEYRKAWIFVAVGSYEGFGVPTIEAMACGTPVLSTINPGAVEVIEHNHNGMLTQEEGLGGAILRLLTDPALRERLARNGRRAVCRKYDIAEIAARYESLYESLRG